MLKRGISSAGQSTCLARRGSTVRLRYPPQKLKAEALNAQRFLNYWKVLFILMFDYSISIGLMIRDHNIIYFK